MPPSIVDGRSSNDLVVREKERVNLTCEASGYPEPQILWRREDGKPIMASGMGSDKGEATDNQSRAEIKIISTVSITSLSPQEHVTAVGFRFALG